MSNAPLLLAAQAMKCLKAQYAAITALNINIQMGLQVFNSGAAVCP